MMQAAEHWNECWHCNPKKFAQAYSPQDCPCKCHVSPTPDSMKHIEFKDAGNFHPTPTDSWEKEFDNFVSINELYPKGADVGKLKSFISEVRQKAVEETLRDLYAYEESKRKWHFHQKWNASKQDSKACIWNYGKSKGIEL